MPCQDCQFKSASDESLLAVTRNLDLSDECKSSRGSDSRPSPGGCSCGCSYCSPPKPKSCSCCCGNCCACCRCCSGSRGDYCRERTEAARGSSLGVKNVEQEQSAKCCASCESCSARRDVEAKVKQPCSDCESCIAKKAEQKRRIAESTSCSCPKCA